LTPSEAERHGLVLNKDGRRRSAFELLSMPGIDLARLAGVWPQIGRLDHAIAEQLAVDAKYHTYVKRQEEDVASLRRDEAVRIPEGFDYGTIAGLSNEARQKLAAHKPMNMAQAARIDGMTPAALMLLAANLKKNTTRKTA
jgi:tRNA uridine 5-carboxymethylaminomethyl modification enzyme